MEKNCKFLKRSIQWTNCISTRNNFQSLNTSKMHSPQNTYRTQLNYNSPSHSTRKTDKFTTDTEGNYLQVKKQPLLSSSHKYLRNTQCFTGKCQEQHRQKTNYLEEGKIIHRYVDWIKYNISNCMYQIWKKNEETFNILNSFFQPSNKQLHLNNLNFFKSINVTEEKKIYNSKLKDQSQGQNKLKDQSSIVDIQFPQFEEQQLQSRNFKIKNILNLIFLKNSSSKLRNQQYHQISKIKKIDRSHNNESKNKKFASIISNNQQQMINQINSRNIKIYPLLLDFARKILMQKQNQLIQKLLKNQKLNNGFLDNLGFQQKVKVFENILVKRIQDFEFLKNNYFKIDKNTQFQLEQQHKFLSQCVAKGLINSNLIKKFNNKNSRKNQANPFLDVKKIIGRSSNLQDFDNLKKQKNQLRYYRNSYDSAALQKLNKHGFGLKNVNIQFNSNFSPNEQQKLRKNNNFIKKKNKNQRYSMADLQIQFGKEQQQFTKRSQKQILKSMKSLIELPDLDEKTNPHIKQSTIRNRQKTRQNIRSSNYGSQNISIKQKQNHVNFQNSTKNVSYQNSSLSNHKDLLKQNGFDILRKTDRNNFMKEVAKKAQNPNKKYFFKNKRNGIQFNPLKTKQFLQFLHAKNKTKFTENQPQTPIHLQNDKQKQKFFTADNSPAKNKNENNLNEKNKPSINFNAKKQKKDSERKVRKRVEKRKTFKIKQNINAQQVEKESKQFAKLKRVKFQNLNLIPKKIIQMILSQKHQIDKQKNSIILRDKIIAYFNKLLQSGALSQGQLAKYKQNIETLMRNYDAKRRTMNVKKSFTTQKQQNQINSQNNVFNINQKIRHDDPLLFQRLKHIQNHLKQNQTKLLWPAPLSFTEDLHSEINEYEQNYKSYRRNWNVEFDLQFSDFFSPVRTKYEDEDGVKYDDQMRQIKQDQGKVLDFMKKFIQKSCMLLSQKDI